MSRTNFVAPFICQTWSSILHFEAQYLLFEPPALSLQSLHYAGIASLCFV